MKVKKTQGKCIFCNSYGVTKEHVWPQWAHDLIKMGPEGTYREEAHIFTRKTQYINSPLLRTRPGEVKNKTLRVVCRNCNGGWMSALEQKTKPLLQALIAGMTFQLNHEDCSLITKWIIMKCFVTEQSRPEESAFSALERKQFMELRSIPENVTVYLGFCGEDAWSSAYLRHSAKVGKPNEPSPADNIRNIQSISFGIGGLFISMSHCRIKSTITRLLDQHTHLIRIYPETRMALWPPIQLTWQDANKIANFQNNILSSNLTQWRP